MSTAAIAAYSTTETALPTRSPRGSTSCCPPHTNLPTGLPAAAATCTTEIATSTTVARSAAATLTPDNLADGGDRRRSDSPVVHALSAPTTSSAEQLLAP